MRKLLMFKLHKLNSYVYILTDKVNAVRVFGECVRIYTDSGFFDVDSTIEAVVENLP